MKLTVNKKHIEKGRKGDTSECAIALALREAVAAKLGKKADIDVSVDDDQISFKVYTDAAFGNDYYYGGDPIEFTAACPKKAATFIEKFDENKKSVKPFSFNVKFDKTDKTFVKNEIADINRQIAELQATLAEMQNLEKLVKTL